MSIEVLGSKSLHCHDGCPLCVLDSGYPIYSRRVVDEVDDGVAVIFCENGCCNTPIPFVEFKRVMKELDEALKWENDIKFSNLCEQNPRNLMIVPILVQHAPSKWYRAVEWDEVDEEEILRRADSD